MLQKVKGSENEERRKEVFSGYGRLRGGFPAWVSRKDRRLLQTASTPTNYDLVVAKDGSGNFTTIGAAVDAAPNSSTTRFVIYIKAGAYFENVEVVRKKTMLMFLGDGIGRTVVKASRNVVDGWTTFQSATVGKSANFTVYLNNYTNTISLIAYLLDYSHDLPHCYPNSETGQNTILH